MKGKNIARIVILSAAVFVFSADMCHADIQWLPKYQEKLASGKRVSDITNPTFYNQTSCEAMGWLSEVPANQSCSPKYMPGGIKCWSDCKCEAKYKYAPGKGVAGGCPNGQTVNTDSCGGLYSGCVDCSTNTPKLCQKCIPKVCADYNSDYVTANDTTKACGDCAYGIISNGTTSTQGNTCYRCGTQSECGCYTLENGLSLACKCLACASAEF